MKFVLISTFAARSLTGEIMFLEHFLNVLSGLHGLQPLNDESERMLQGLYEHVCLLSNSNARGAERLARFETEQT